MASAPHLRFSGGDSRAEAVVLLLHGGMENHFSRVQAFDPAVLRLIPFGRSVVRAGGGRITLASLRYAVRGWNGERFGSVPVGLVGHSMGGRVALRVADHSRVRSVAALAPWLPPAEPIPALEDRTVLLAHGTADRTTDPRSTAQLAVKLREEGVEVEQHEFIGGRHSMLFPAGAWHDMVAEFMVRTLLTSEPGASRS